MVKRNRGYMILANVVMMSVTVCVVLPFLLLFMSSITSESALLRDGYSFIPTEFSLESYAYIFLSLIHI